MCEFFFRTGIDTVKVLRKDIINLCGYTHTPLNTWRDMSIYEYMEWHSIVAEIQNEKSK